MCKWSIWVVQSTPAPTSVWPVSVVRTSCLSVSSTTPEEPKGQPNRPHQAAWCQKVNKQKKVLKKLSWGEYRKKINSDLFSSPTVGVLFYSLTFAGLFSYFEYFDCSAPQHQQKFLICENRLCNNPVPDCGRDKAQRDPRSLITDTVNKFRTYEHWDVCGDYTSLKCGRGKI